MPSSMQCEILKSPLSTKSAMADDYTAKLLRISYYLYFFFFWQRVDPMLRRRLREAESTIGQVTEMAGDRAQRAYDRWKFSSVVIISCVVIICVAL